MDNAITVHMEEGEGFFAITAKALYRTFTYTQGDANSREGQFHRARAYAQGVGNGIRQMGGDVKLALDAKL